MKVKDAIDSAMLLTEGEVAKILQLSLQSLRKARYEKRGIPYLKFGGTIRYERKDVVKWLSQLQRYPLKPREEKEEENNEPVS